MATVYWAPWYPNQTLYTSLHLLYDSPPSLLQEIKGQQNPDNRNDNWFQCHAFLNTVRNSFVLKYPMSFNFALDNRFGLVNLIQNDPNFEYLTVKNPSVIDAYTISTLNNWIFWSDEPLIISSIHFILKFLY